MAVCAAGVSAKILPHACGHGYDHNHGHVDEGVDRGDSLRCGDRRQGGLCYCLARCLSRNRRKSRRKIHRTTRLPHGACGRCNRLEEISDISSRTRFPLYPWKISCPSPRCQLHLLPIEYAVPPQVQREGAVFPTELRGGGQDVASPR